MLQDIGIFYPEISTNIFRYHIGQSVGSLSKLWTYYNNTEYFRSNKHGRKIACFQIPYPYNNSVELLIDDLYDHCDTIIVLGSELHSRTVDFIRRYDRQKIFYFLCGRLNPLPHNSRTRNFLDWFTTSVHFYKYIKPSVLYTLNPYEPKPLMFDVLLGRKKPHRDQAYEFVHTHNLKDQCLVTYMNSTNLDTDWHHNQEKWIWEDQGLENASNVQWTVDRVKYHGYNMSLSQIIPLNIYNQTAYSLVCETNFDNDYVFFTEKTVKPILARRLFILLGNRYALATLRDLGFQTFGSIIDESYDEIEDTTLRCAAALEQMQWLCKQDQTDILNRCRPIVEHNFDVMSGKNWYQEFTQDLRRSLINQ